MKSQEVYTHVLESYLHAVRRFKELTTERFSRTKYVNKIYWVILVFFCQTAFGQFAVIESNDGFVNVRSSGGITHNITDTLANGQIVFCFQAENNWCAVDYELDGRNRSGHIHQSGLKLITSFTTIPRKVLTKNSILFRLDNITFSMTVTDFVASLNELQYHTGNPQKDEATYLEKINGQEIWGTDGNVPQKQYGQILLELRSKKIKLSAENLFEPNLEYTTANIDTPNETIYIAATNSDGAGAYAVLWVIKGGRFEKRVITN